MASASHPNLLCFLCSAEITTTGGGGGEVEATARKRFSIARKSLFKYLLMDLELEAPLSKSLLQFMEDDGQCDRSCNGNGGGNNVSRLFQFCTSCDKLARNVHELSLQLEIIQKKVEDSLETVRKSVIRSGSRLGGRKGIMRAGIDCARKRRLLKLKDEFRGFVFKNRRDNFELPGLAPCLERREEPVSIKTLADIPSESNNDVASTEDNLEDDAGMEMEEDNFDEPEPDPSIQDDVNEDVKYEAPVVRSSKIPAEGDINNAHAKSMCDPSHRLQKRTIISSSSTSRRLKYLRLRQHFENEIEQLNLSASLRKEFKHSDIKHNKFWSCESCGTKVRGGCKIEEHLRQHETSVHNFTCKLCNIGFTQKQYFILHLVLFHRKHRKCDVCAELVVPNGMETHLKTHADKVYHCDKCSHVFGKFETLVSHLCYHTRGASLRCELCAEENVELYDVRLKMKQHLYERHGLKHFLLECRFEGCSEAFISLLERAKHENSHERKRKICKLCNESFPTKYGLISHKVTQHNDLRFKCDLCDDMKFTGDSSLRNHRAKVHGIGRTNYISKRYQCSTCFKKFSTKLNFQNHEKTAHQKSAGESQTHRNYDFVYKRNSAGNLYCVVCNDETIEDAQALSIHYVLKHNFPKYKCEQCPEVEYNSFAGLHSHERHKHGIGKPLPQLHCSFCYKTCVTQTALKKHEATHSEEKDFSCDQCGFATKTSNLLKRHIMQRHTTETEKRHVCSYCPKRFAIKGVLLSHLRTHTGEKPFKCDQCGAAFTQRTPLMRHISRSH